MGGGKIKGYVELPPKKQGDLRKPLLVGEARVAFVLDYHPAD